MQEFFTKKRIVGFFILYIIFDKILVPRIVASLNGSILDSIVNAVAAPLNFWHGIIPEQTQSEFYKWVFITFSIFIFTLIYLGIHFLFTLHAKGSLFRYNPSSIGQDELSNAVTNLDSHGPQSIETLDSFSILLDEYEKGIAKIFSLKERDYRCYWLISTGKDEAGKFTYETLSKYENLNEHDIHIIDSSLAQKRRKWEGNVKGQYDNYAVNEFAYARNDGEFKIALIFFIYKEKTVTEKTKEMFKIATSNVMLLGHISGISNILLDISNQERG